MGEMNRRGGHLNLDPISRSGFKNHPEPDKKLGWGFKLHPDPDEKSGLSRCSPIFILQVGDSRDCPRCSPMKLAQKHQEKSRKILVFPDFVPEI